MFYYEIHRRTFTPRLCIRTYVYSCGGRIGTFDGLQNFRPLNLGSSTIYRSRMPVPYSMFILLYICNLCI